MHPLTSQYWQVPQLLPPLSPHSCSALVPSPLTTPNWEHSSRNLTSCMTTTLASTLPTLGKWHTKSHGMERGIAFHWLSPYPTPNIPFTSLSPSGMEVMPPSNVHQLEASAFEWKGSLPNHPSATISFAREGLVLQAQFPMVLFPLLLEGGPPPFYPLNLQGIPLGLSPCGPILHAIVRLIANNVQGNSPPLRLALALLLSTQLTTIKVGPGLGTFFSSFSTSRTLLPSLWPPRPLESKVIQIQSDHPLAASPPVAAMERSKVTALSKFVEES